MTRLQQAAPAARTVLLPSTVEEAVDGLLRVPEAIPVAGGTDLMVATNAARLRPAALLGLGGVAELRGWRYDDGGHAVLGAGLTHARLGRPDLAVLIPALAAAARTAGPPQIRNAGTLGGNLVTAAATGDLLPALVALDAVVLCTGPDGHREIPVGNLLAGLSMLGPAELVTAVRVPMLPAPQEYLKATARAGASRALVSVALVLDPARRAVRCAVGAVAPAPLRPLRAEEWVSDGVDWSVLASGKALDPEALPAFGQAVAEECLPGAADEADPGTVTRPGRAQLARMVSVLARRALERCLTRAAGGER